MSEKVQELLMERGNSFGLILDDISIVSTCIIVLVLALVIVYRYLTTKLSPSSFDIPTH